jgi:transposase-like protein
MDIGSRLRRLESHAAGSCPECAKVSSVVEIGGHVAGEVVTPRCEACGRAVEFMGYTIDIGPSLETAG